MSHSVHTESQENAVVSTRNHTRRINLESESEPLKVVRFSPTEGNYQTLKAGSELVMVSDQIMTRRLCFNQ